MVDAGGSASPRYDPGERVVVPVLLSRGVRRLEALVLTHDHVDHAGGAFAVLKELEVGELWLGPRSSRSERASSLAALARDRGAAVVMAEGGLKRELGGLPLRVLAPDRQSSGRGDNDASVVVLAGLAPARVLVTGDLEQPGEAALERWASTLRAEALVVGHHGSGDASSAGFLDLVAPRWALVSVGYRNRFGHPHPEVLSRLRERGARVLRTDLHGLIHLREASRGWQATTERSGVDETERDRDEAEHEQQKQQDGQQPAARTE
jgi:competence protein ComEC